MRWTTFIVLIVLVLVTCDRWPYPAWYAVPICPQDSVAVHPVDSAAAVRLCSQLYKHGGNAQVIYFQRWRCLRKWQRDSTIWMMTVDAERCYLRYYPDEPCLRCSGRTW